MLKLRGWEYIPVLLILVCVTYLARVKAYPIHLLDKVLIKPAFTCSKSTMETLEKCVKYIQ